MLLAMRITATAVLIAAMYALVWALKEGGVMFLAGAALATAIFHLGYRAKHGVWFNLID